ncbi:2-C-methyl-D-erythritol 4-phosphate cytidylyltransferase [Thermosulfuriphilus ammonigenes]|uniref:2-C-methyl-D-erythritol 4-phosphate cytidylyltransferase n=1 Tax=Thermosulfuriphilus ammonigenes TaxID=1936021 RepID=A0A6G7PWC0_9BACT|nr:2-C-methyl-D-erythritol 4-phosphate cytidylyltransferase [Thermosulfuriphilus ammonigenes]MBA2847815.1 2-C-methyl-D-erythritol 4-phosphate cytidylyltransferase [Thermosulfuriphilus ammonigenes]QIJ71984.1 2-C-methyl-D-erythritol 4-phosphate cytidylyltransferase [Thermosulfuriphilus ammonigenes]
MNAAVIAAGGTGSRLGAEIPKQFLEIRGKALLLYSLEAFEACPEVEIIVVVAVSSYIKATQRLISEAGLKKVQAVVQGGATRQDSVWAGFKALPSEVEIVLVHDAARPLVSTGLIQTVINKVRETGAAIAACPVRDTVKEVHHGTITRTLPREALFLAQTPQGARKELLQQAFERAQEEGFQATDEASLLERLGIPVAVVPAPTTNLKITSPEDLLLLEALLQVTPRRSGCR